MIIKRLKLYAGFALAFILSLISAKHYRDKSKRLAQDIKVMREVDAIEREIREQIAHTEAINEQVLRDELERAEKGIRDKFERDPFQRMRDD